MKKRILVVDDEWAILELLKFKLLKRGYHVVTAKDENEFCEQAMAQRFDLIILDIWLRDKIGTDVYHHLLGAGLDPEIPVIFITALMEEGHTPARAGEGRKFALYGKPFNFEEFMEEVKRLVHNSSEGSSLLPENGVS